MLDEFIRLKQLHEFSIEILQLITEEKTHKARWEYYLHRVFDMSFDEYVSSCKKMNSKEMISKETGKKSDVMSDDEIKEKLNMSMEVWKEFGWNPQ